MRIVEAGTQMTLRSAETLQFLPDVVAEFLGGLRSSVRQSFLGLVPHAFVRVQLRGIRRKVFEVQARVLGPEFPDRVALVNGAVVPHDDYMPWEVAEKLPHEVTGLRMANVGLVDLEVKPNPVSPRANRQAGDDRDLVMFVPVRERRRVASGPPRPAHGPCQHEPRFVDEYEVGAQPRSPFFIRGHSSFFHRSISSSLRWSARRSGFWTLQSRRCKRRPTWSR